MKTRLLLICLLYTITGFTQQLPLSRTVRTAIEKQTRSVNGKPGTAYWQNTASYTLDIHFNPDQRLLQGREEVIYINNSPDTLREIVFKLYPNLYKKGAVRNMPIEPADLTDGVQIDSLLINKEKKEIASLAIEGTNMIVRVKGLLPKESIRFDIGYHYTLNRKSHIRTGEIEEGAAFVAYFFPRIAVYDDIDGWNKTPYLGQQEFYNDFCTFHAAITVPAGYLVWATGDLINTAEVLNEAYAARLSTAEQQDGITTIIDTGDILHGNITRNNSENTFKFSAREVSDFVFAISNHYIWKSTSLVVDPKTGRRTRVDAVFNPKHRDYYEVIDFARKTVQAMSYTFPKWPFPYPHITVFDGLDQMEYPMMVNDNPLEDREEAIELTDHEIFHTMFPFYMGINETKYAWMDEGWATIGEWLISPMIDSTITDTYGISAYAKGAGTEMDLPIVTPSTQSGGNTYFLNSYPKPGMGYLYVKDLLGDSLFTVALHYYIEQWHGKHPLPSDFFNCMNTGSGKNLNWFWKKWFFENGYPDLAIGKVKKETAGYSVTINNKGDKPVPVDLNITYENGKKEVIHRTIAVWEKANSCVININTTGKIAALELYGPHTPDSYPANNKWKK